MAAVFHSAMAEFDSEARVHAFGLSFPIWRPSGARRIEWWMYGLSGGSEAVPRLCHDQHVLGCNPGRANQQQNQIRHQNTDRVQRQAACRPVKKHAATLKLNLVPA